ncbi:MAG: hypothetical protein OXG23_13215 [Chloroflexi bacterium]|nr:hypothetical protein [Chloroflexota bacterium]
MRHLWTTVTTEHTVTHDAGEPEWLDLPIDDFVIPSTPDVEQLPVLYELDPPWQLRSKWMMDEGDIGYLLVPLVEFRDPLGVTLFQEEATLERAEELQYPVTVTTEAYMVGHRFRDLWYTLPGLYTLIVRWVGSPATRETGRFSLFIKES